MPTGYTADVQSGKVTEFNEFAMQCARAFGALVMMRDEASDAAIPERFEPSDYHQKALVKAKAELSRLEGLSPEAIESERNISETQRLKDRDAYCKTKSDHRARYESMLRKVEAWVPPSDDHTPMKDFMVKQLSESIDFDCREGDIYETPTPDATDWHEGKIAEARRSVAYHTEENAKEIERTESRNQWLADLRASLIE